MPLGSPFIESTPLRFSSAGKQAAFLASMLGQSGLLHDPAGKPMVMFTSDPTPLLANTADQDVLFAGAAISKAGYFAVVFSVQLSATAASKITFGSRIDATTTAISIPFDNPATDGEVLGHNEHGWFRTAAGGKLVASVVGGTAHVQVNFAYLNAAYFKLEGGMITFLEDGEPMLAEAP